MVSEECQLRLTLASACMYTRVPTCAHTHTQIITCFEKQPAAEPWPALAHPVQGLRLPVTHQGDADGILVLLGEDAHHGRAQQQQDQGVPELEGEQQGRSQFHKGWDRLLPATVGQLRPSRGAGLPGPPYSG